MNYLDNKILTLKYSLVICSIFLSLFFIDVAFGDTKIEKQSLRSFINIAGFKNIYEVSTLKRTELVVGIIENRFVATGVIIDIKHTAEGPQRFVMHIKEIEHIGDYANFGKAYLDKSVEVFSEIGIPSSFLPEVEVSLVLRVSGDEWGQVLFLVEVINNDKI
ncbi:MAG: hypothetical protein ACYSTS_08725 [Planctomycetota bacterium]|jgi:hypothetical protein